MQWKYEQAAASVEYMRAGKKADTQRIARSRISLRGFKDMEKNVIAHYQGTSGKSSQKVLVSESVRRRWDICTTDIGKAFLQGVTHEGVAKLTGEPERKVKFYLPPHNVAMLRTFAGIRECRPTNISYAF